MEIWVYLQNNLNLYIFSNENIFKILITEIFQIAKTNLCTQHYVIVTINVIFISLHQIGSLDETSFGNVKVTKVSKKKKKFITVTKALFNEVRYKLIR